MFLNPQDTDLSVPGSGIHPLNEGYVNHELVPILTMDPNSSSGTNVIGGTTASVGGSSLLRTTNMQGNVPLASNLTTARNSYSALMTTQATGTTSAAETTLMDGIIGLGSDVNVISTCGHNVGVYTLAEEPELEADVPTIDRI